MVGLWGYLFLVKANSMNKLYRQVSVIDREPEKYGYYDTDVGNIEYSPTNGWQYGMPYPDYWLEEIELPSEEDINWKYPLNANEPHKTTLNVGCRTGANYILNKLKGEK